MTDTPETPEIARIRESLKAGPTPGPWNAGNKGYVGPISTDDDQSFGFVITCAYAFDENDARYIAACNPDAMTSVLAHIDAQASEIARLKAIIADCRDAAPIPAKWSEADSKWQAAIGFPEGVPGFVKASFDVQSREIERLRKDASRYRFIRDADRSDTHIDDIALYAMGSLDEYIDAAMKEQK